MKTVLRGACALGVMVAGLSAAPASAQFFLKNYDYAGAPVQGDEPGIMQTLPDATPTEKTAALVWTMRSALNVAALQCQFEPSLLTVGNYNAILTDHQEELKNTWTTLMKYFARTAKSAKAGEAAIDAFGTRTYSSFATVSSQYGFCRTASSIGREALFMPRGSLATLAQTRMRELRNSLVPYGEQRFSRYIGFDRATLPRLDTVCWGKKGEWQVKKCGSIGWPPAGAAVAAAQ
ncbi:hypothetical protein QE361_001130 [Sphingomonas sp. SORGH_AS802]|uniref:hypothetical protein n=1 Tax=unclassified Sphingomonas TaxID=196159 RepID=UPI002861F669|nr:MULTISPECIES: hypothetical protein [unclassified Sphingomonas]MDR6125540.1 hypothetical protein [Sphingomonas sp. SORGH_AS_0438]MDR6134155.1 hypothetical protein [Sphingomonas sp. SORGH_AS_0802]